MKDEIHFWNLFIGHKVFCEGLLSKLLVDYTSFIAFFTPNIIVRGLNVSNGSTRAGSNSTQAET